MFRPLCILGACLVASACDGARPDVLREFPPPRLARENANTVTPRDSAPTDCKATWRLFGRRARETYHFAGRGTFDVHGQPPTLVSGIIAFDPLEAKPELRESVERALRTRGDAAPWVWRVLRVQPPELNRELVAEAAPGSSALTGLSELELNGVRTRQNQGISVKLTPDGEDLGELSFQTQLRVDLGAHHIRGIALQDGSPPARADLVVDCRLRTANDAP